MSKFNGTGILAYADGVEIAAQKGLSMDLTVKLFDTTNKQSGGWEEHGNGLRGMTIPIDALQSTTGLSDKELFDFIKNRTSLMLVITGFTYPYVAEVDMGNMNITAPTEEAVGLSGSFTVQGRPYRLAGTNVQMISDPDGNTSDYDTLTVSGIAITSAIKSTAGNKKCDSNTISVAITGVYKLFVFVTLNSGALPTVGIWDNTSAYISNTQVLTAGFNLVTLTATATDASASLRFSNTAMGNWSTSNIYLFKV